MTSLCRICFRFGNDCLLTPSLRLFSQVSSLLWFSPTSDKPSGSLRLQDLNRPYLDSGICQTSQVCRYYLVRSPRSLTPTEPTAFSLIDCRITACDPEDGIGFRSIYLTGLYCFTLSHCGSRTPLPTLKPCLAALAPRLCTGCLLGFTGFGISPKLYYLHRTGAPSAVMITTVFVKFKDDYKYL